MWLDVGKINFIENDILQEDAYLPGDDFREIWERYSTQSFENDCAFEILSKVDLSILGYFLIVGEWFAFSIRRPEISPNGLTIFDCESVFLEDFNTNINNTNTSIHSMIEYVQQHVTVAGKTDTWNIIYALDETAIGINFIEYQSKVTDPHWNNLQWKLVEGSIPGFLQAKLSE